MFPVKGTAHTGQTGKAFRGKSWKSAAFSCCLFFSHLTILHWAQAHTSLNLLWISYVYSRLVTWVCPLSTLHKGTRLLCFMVSLSKGQMSVLLAKIQFVTDCWYERHVKEHLSLPCGYPASIIPPPWTAGESAELLFHSSLQIMYITYVKGLRIKC